MGSYITLTPSDGAVGTVVSIAGGAFTPSSTITVTYSDSTSTFTADSSGNFTGSITFPSSAYDDNAVVATDGTNTSQAFFNLLPEPEYCSVEDVADWFSIDIDENTRPNKRQVSKWILANQERIDYLTGHTWQATKFYIHDQANVWSQYQWGRGMPIELKHRYVKPFDTTQGDTFEIWDGQSWVAQSSDDTNFVYFDEQKGIAFIRGYLYTALVDNRFRIKYRYGGNNEGTRAVPRDIQKCCWLMTAIDYLSRDFKMSQVAYGAEGTISKMDIIKKWQDEVNNIIWAHSEFHTVI